jgi:hypothetical protein
MKAIVLFLLSIMLTAVFSYSLEIFLKEDFISLTLQTMLVPCFTWSMLLLAALQKFTKERFVAYFTLAGLVCAVGSAVLVPGGVYNFMVTNPAAIVSVINVLASVVIMSGLFYVLLRRNNFSIKWWWAYNILICINMTLFYFVAIR